MSLTIRLLPAIMLVFLAVPSFAASSPYSSVPYNSKYNGAKQIPAGEKAWAVTADADAVLDNKQPNLLSFGLGWFDSSENTPRDQALDMRFEYRWGLSLLSTASSMFSGWDRYVQLHPFLGLEASSRAQFYGVGGLALDVFIFDNLIFTPSTGFGLYSRGEGKDLGDVIEFRSMAEIAYRFQNNVRSSVYLSHISNAGMGTINPGAQTLGIYLHVPTNVMFGK